jgi:hypothetical protein
VSVRIFDPKMDSKIFDIYNYFPFSWSEFKIETDRKHQYALHLVKLIFKYLNKKFEVEYGRMRKEEKLLFTHIIEANEIADLKSWIGIGMIRK